MPNAEFVKQQIELQVNVVEFLLALLRLALSLSSVRNRVLVWKWLVCGECF